MNCFVKVLINVLLRCFLNDQQSCTNYNIVLAVDQKPTLTFTLKSVQLVQQRFLRGVGYVTLTHQMTKRCSVVLRVDGYNRASPGPSANQGQMMSMSGRGGTIGPEGTTNMGTPLMSENGAMVMYQEK